MVIRWRAWCAVVWCGVLSGLCEGQRPRPQAQPMRLPENVRMVGDLVYCSALPRPLKLDLYLPKGTAAQEKLAVVVWVHGGAWRAGDKRPCPMVPLVADGYAVASIQYRLSHEALFPAQIHDCKAAVRFLRAHAAEYGLDGDRIAVAGASAGGHLAALMGTSAGVAELEGERGWAGESSRVQAVVDLFGPAHLSTMHGQLAARGGNPQPPGRTPECVLLGGPVADLPEKARLASPVCHVSADDPPFLILHGEDDRLVPVDQSRELHDALEKVGVRSRLKTFVGLGHGIPPAESLPLIRAFLKEALAGGEATSRPVGTAGE